MNDLKMSLDLSKCSKVMRKLRKSTVHAEKEEIEKRLPPDSTVVTSSEFILFLFVFFQPQL